MRNYHILRTPPLLRQEKLTAPNSKIRLIQLLHWLEQLRILR